MPPNPPAPLVLLPDLASTQGCSLAEGRGEGEEEMRGTNCTKAEQAGLTRRVPWVCLRGATGAPRHLSWGEWKIRAGRISGIP